MIVPLKMIVSCTMPPPVTRPAAKVKIVPAPQVVKCPAPQRNCERHTGDATERPPVLRETIEGGV